MSAAQVLRCPRRMRERASTGGDTTAAAACVLLCAYFLLVGDSAGGVGSSAWMEGLTMAAPMRTLKLSAPHASI